MMMTVDPVDDIRTQAHQGSVAAIIQVLNEKLADAGIRTRAVFEDGVLQLLCEAETPQQMEQAELVTRIRRILEALEPKGIRKVNISSRIVREQQLLWLQEISRDPDDLLWSERITLKQSNFVKRFLRDRKSHRGQMPLPQTASPQRAKQMRSFWRGIVGGASLSVLLLVVGWTMRDWLSHNFDRDAVLPSVDANASSDDSATDDATPQAQENPSAQPAPSSRPVSTDDPFVQAVRLAEQAAIDGQAATSSAEWLDLAARWQQASDLMEKVTSDDERYQTARNRTEEYKRNSRTALAQAESIQ